MNAANQTALPSESVVYWALNNYGVTGFDIFINMFIVLLAGWIIGLNLLVLHTLLKIAPSREPADYFVCSLSVADALSGVFLLYNTSYNLSNYQVFHECLFRQGLIQVVGLTSVFHMAALTVDRYLKIVRPYHYSTVCKKMSVIVVSITMWIICLLIGFLPLFGWHKEREASSTDTTSQPVCGFFVIFNQTYLKVVVTLFWCPIVFMTVMYLHIFKIARRHARLIAVQDKTKGLPARERHSWKYTKTVCLVIGVYFLSWVPSGVVIMLDFEDRLGDRSTVEKGTLLLYVSSIAFLNSLVNPIIYAFKITSVRMRFRSVFCRKSVKLSDIEQSRTDAPVHKVAMSRTRVTTLATTTISEIDMSE